MMASALKVAAVLCSFGVASAARLSGEAVTNAVHQETSTSRFGAKVESRFEMHHVLWQQDLDTRVLKHVPLPPVVTNNFGNSKELFAGSFGEAWAATDIATGKKVVVKMFYTTVGGQRQHITWASSQNNIQLQSQLKDAAGECTVALEMQMFASTDPTGASRLMQCYEDHVTLGTSITKHTVSKHDELFQVLEDCGGLPLSKWMHAQVKKGMTMDYFDNAMGLYRQLIEGLNYLTGHRTKWVHHDLKPDNAVVKPLSNGKFVLKIIDFGSVTEVSTLAAQKAIVSTVAYAAPEWFPIARGFDATHPSSFDTYQAGTILDELTTGTYFYDKLSARATLPTPQAIQACVMQMRTRAGLPTYGQIVMDQGYKDMEAGCMQELSIDTVKGSSGSEKRITGNWGKGVTSVASGFRNVRRQVRDRFGYLVEAIYQEPIETHIQLSWEDGAPKLEAEVEAFIFSNVDPAFKYVAVAYQNMARRTGWYPTMMKTLAWDTKVRATPSEILKSEFMNLIASVPDPDYDAATAQSRANALKEVEAGVNAIYQSGGHVRPQSHLPTQVYRPVGGVIRVQNSPHGPNWCPDYLRNKGGYFRLCYPSPVYAGAYGFLN